MHEIRFDKYGEVAAIGEVDVTEYQFADGDTVLLQNELYRLVMDNWHFRNMVEEMYDHVQEEEWTGIGVVTNADGSLFHAGVTTDDYGRHYVGNGHMCEVARLASNGQAIEAALKDADLRDYRAEEGKDRERWFEGTEDVYLYDLGAVAIQKEVLSIERALSDYPILNEEVESEIMDEMWLSAFHQSLPRLDSSIDADELEQEFRGEIVVTCPECGWNKDPQEYLEESDDYSECNDCGDWFDVEADGTEKVPHPLCPSCGGDFRARREEADEACQEVYDFDPSNGDGLVIRWTDGYYYEWFANRQEWVKRMKFKDTYVVNE